jgi:hypothetical protein
MSIQGNGTGEVSIPGDSDFTCPNGCILAHGRSPALITDHISGKSLFTHLWSAKLIYDFSKPLTTWQLILNDNSNTPLARYRRAKLGIVSRSRRAFIEILPAGLGVVDLIVVTFVSFMKQRVAIDYPSSPQI